VAKLIKSLKMPIDEDVATNLYSGIKKGSADFQAAKVTADTFELAAFLLKNGAKKDHLVKETFNYPVKPAVPAAASPVSASTVNQANSTNLPSSSNQLFSSSPATDKPQAPFLKDNKEDEKKSQPPPDWFKPKIYKGDRAV